MPENNKRFTPKELSWLSFNARVLQEAQDPTVPLIERIRFLGIYSSNLDEFFRVRVATLKRLIKLGKAARELVPHDPREVMEQVMRRVLKLHDSYNNTYQQLIVELERKGIRIVNERQLEADQVDFLKEYFRKHIQAELSPLLIKSRDPLPDLQDSSIYLAVRMWDSSGKRKKRHALVELPQTLKRFVVIPGKGPGTTIIMIDDIVRLMLPSIFALFRQNTLAAWTVKITRDAELDLDDDLSLSYAAKMAASLKKREHGQPVRFVYDEAIPEDFLVLLRRKLRVRAGDTVLPGGRYHNRSDLIHFPEVGKKNLRYPPALARPHAGLPASGSMLSAIRKKDCLLHFPYNPFSQFVDLLREAALDPKVQRIQITLYRAARNSDVIRNLITASRNGKKVTAVVELQARFDEKANIKWAEQMREEGVEVVFGVAGLKVHSKLVLIERTSASGVQRHACIGTGNFNEDTARAFEDLLLLTADSQICKEVNQIFRFFRKSYLQLSFRKLLASPWNTRQVLEDLIRYETEEARRGREASIHIKVNNLADYALIEFLYEAAEAGVDVRLNVRGMFSVRPGLEGVSGGLEAMTVIDRYLEHSRVLRFHHGGKARLYLGSGDLLPRNMERRVEAFVPVQDPDIQHYVESMLGLYWKDNRKARILDKDLCNTYRGTVGKGGRRVQNQIARLNRKLHGGKA